MSVCRLVSRVLLTHVKGMNLYVNTEPVKVQTVVNRHVAWTSKKRMLVLCHGRKHRRKLNKDVKDEYDLVYVDHCKKCDPDIVMDLTGKDTALLSNHGPFDAVAFIFAPFTVFAHPQMRSIVPELLKQNNGVIFKHDDDDGVIDLDEEDSFSNYKFFRLETWESLFPNTPIKFLNLL